MNLPGRLGGNWGWRFRRGQLTDAERERLLGLTETYGR
jgi:4-alpha-glucanotransferase